MNTPRTWLTAAVSLFVILPIAAGCVLWLGASASLDWDHAHSARTRTLPTLDATSLDATSPGVVRILAGAHEFRARIAGVGGARGNLVLLHGFAESSAMWQPLIDAAADAGYQVLAFDQRGYSPGARPAGEQHYGLDRLAQDARDVAQAVGFQSFHLVGHGWGARAGWQLVLTGGEGIDTWTALSMPHSAAFEQALDNDPEQQRRSRYLRWLKVPWLPEQVLAFNRFEILRNTLWAGYADAQIDEYATILGEPGALSAVINWFRAPAPAPVQGPPATPTLLIWGNQDPLLAPSSVLAHRALLQQPASQPVLELELDGGHRLLSSHPGLVTTAILKHLATTSHR